MAPVGIAQGIAGFGVAAYGALTIGNILKPINMSQVGKGGGQQGQQPNSRAYPDKFRRISNNLNEKLAMDEAKAGAGQKIMDNLNDPQFKGMEKWQHVHRNPDGTNTVIHYVRDPKTGQLMDFKFKDD